MIERSSVKISFNSKINLSEWSIGHLNRITHYNEHATRQNAAGEIWKGQKITTWK